MIQTNQHSIGMNIFYKIFVRFVFRKAGKIAEKRSHKVHNQDFAEKIFL